MSSIKLLAGANAKKTILEHGLKPELFHRILAASGGPKWLAIAGLDKYLFGTFFAGHQHTISTLGSSSGAWRLACFAQNDPVAAYSRLEQAYIEQRYDTRPSRAEVARQVKHIIDVILGSLGGEQVLANSKVNTHMVVCRGKHLNRVMARPILAMGLALAAATNVFSRKTLGWHFERLIFGTNHSHSPYTELADLPGRFCHLTADNLRLALQATGSIPLLLPPVTTIPDAGHGHHYDGGITDYHFDIDLNQQPGLTLYPHFYPYMAAGWFDKKLPRRWASHSSENYDNALILAPSDEFIARLPEAKIPDRDDFSRLTTNVRQAQWRQATTLSQYLAEEFHELLETNKYRLLI